MIINQEEFDDIEMKMGELLSDLERKVLVLYLDGRSYQEISDELNRHVKSIDNALQRVKRKLRSTWKFAKSVCNRNLCYIDSIFLTMICY